MAITAFIRSGGLQQFPACHSISTFMEYSCSSFSVDTSENGTKKINTQPLVRKSWLFSWLNKLLWQQYKPMKTPLILILRDYNSKKSLETTMF